MATTVSFRVQLCSSGFKFVRSDLTDRWPRLNPKRGCSNHLTNLTPIIKFLSSVANAGPSFVDDFNWTLHLSPYAPRLRAAIIMARDAFNLAKD